MRRAGLAFTSVVAAALAALTGEAADSPAGAFLFTSTPEYAPSGWRLGGRRFPKGSTVFLARDGTATQLVAELESSADPCISFDGRRALLSGRARGGRYDQIWEVVLDERRVRRVTYCEADCVGPIYLPDGRIAYTKIEAGGSAIETLDGGAKPVRITFTPSRLLTSDVLADGRILFEMARVSSAGSRSELMTMFPDGSGMDSLADAGSEEWFEPSQVADGTIVFLRRDGRPARFDPATETVTGLSGIPGQVLGRVASVGADQMLVVARPKMGERARLYRWNGRTAERMRLRGLADGWAVQPAAIQPRPRPQLFISPLLRGRQEAVLLGLSVGTEGHELAARGVRAWTQDPAGKPLALGVVVLEADGSFYASLKGDRPVRFELLNGAGQVVKRQMHWIWLRAGEQRVCVGRHASREKAPRNASPVALKSGRPVNLEEPRETTGESGRQQ